MNRRNRKKKVNFNDVSDQWLLEDNPSIKNEGHQKEEPKEKKKKKKRRKKKEEEEKNKEEEKTKKKRKKRRKKKEEEKSGKSEKSEKNEEKEKSEGEGEIVKKKEKMKKAKYDPFAHPPDLQMAETYVLLQPKAKTSKEQAEIIKRLCPVSNLDPEAKQHPICGDMFDLNFLGSGFILLFSLIKALTLLLVLLSLSQIPKILSNTSGSFCFPSDSLTSPQTSQTTLKFPSELKDYNKRYKEDIDDITKLCKSSWITSHSLANYGLNIDPQSRIINSIFSILIIGIFVAFYDVYIEDKNSLLDAMNDVPDDFTLIVRGLPKEEKPWEIHDKFQTYGAGARSKIELKVEKVILAYDLEKFIKIEEKLHKAKKDFLKQFSIETKNLKPGEDINEKSMSVKYRNFKEIVENFEKKISKEEEELLNFKRPKSSKGIAFVTFETKRQMEEVKKYWATNKNFLARACSKKSKTKYSTTKDGKLTLHQIWVQEAPLPTDIFWRNLGINPLKLLKRRILTFFLSGLILSICFIAVIGLKSIQIGMKKDQEEEIKKGNKSGNFQFQAVSIVISVLISVINVVLSKSLKFLTGYEKHDSVTDVNRSMVVKTSVTQFLNSCVLICIVHMLLVEPNFQIWASGGVLTDAMFVVLSDVYIAPIMALIDPGYIISKIKQKSLAKQLKKGNYKGTLTQKDANKIFEGRPFDAALTYTKLLKIWNQAIFFLPILPVCSFVAMLGMFFFFWTSKYALLRRAARPVSINFQITATAVFMIRFTPLILGISYLIFDLMLRLKVEVSSIIIIIFGILFLIIPFEYPIEILLKKTFFKTKRVEANLDVSYEDLRYKFPTEYDRENPVTKKIGEIDYANYMNKRLKTKPNNENENNLTPAQPEKTYTPVENFSYYSKMGGQGTLKIKKSTKNENLEFDKNGGYYDKDGYYWDGNGGYYDEEGYYWDEYGGFYDENGKYFDGNGVTWEGDNGDVNEGGNNNDKWDFGK